MITNTACIAEDSNDRNAVTRLLSGTFARNIPPEYAQLQEQLSNVIIGEYSPVLRGSVAIRIVAARRIRDDETEEALQRKVDQSYKW